MTAGAGEVQARSAARTGARAAMSAGAPCWSGVGGLSPDAERCAPPRSVRSVQGLHVARGAPVACVFILHGRTHLPDVTLETLGRGHSQFFRFAAQCGVSQTQSRLAGVRSSPSPESCETLVSVCTLGVWGHWAGHSVWGERTSPTPRMDIPRERPPAPATARARIPLPRPRPAPRRAARKGIIFANSNTRVGLGARSLSSPQCSSAAARAVLKCFNYVYKSAYSEVSISL